MRVLKFIMTDNSKAFLLSKTMYSGYYDNFSFLLMINTFLAEREETGIQIRAQRIACKPGHGDCSVLCTWHSFPRQSSGNKTVRTDSLV